MNLEDLAHEITNWALANHMMSRLPTSPEVDQPLIREVFGAVGLPNAVSILQNRRVTFIGINRATQSVVIFTEKRLKAAELKLLTNAAYNFDNGEFFPVTFIECGSALAGGPPRPPAVAPYSEHAGKYTCGGSIYIGSEKGAGTLGCLVRKDGEIYGLSNNHVVGACNYAPIGLPIVIPGGVDVTAGGRDPETIGHLHCAYPLLDGRPDVVNCDNNIDAALFRISNPDRLSSLQRNHFDTPTSMLPLATGMEVEKVGRTTGLTRGTVVAEIVGYTPVDCPIPIFGGRKLVYFKNMFMVQPTTSPAFSQGGDSGSLIVHTDSDGNRHAVGIVVGGTPEGICLALSIDRIVNHFGVTLLGSHNV